jgi:hypothetical protein
METRIPTASHSGTPNPDRAQLLEMEIEYLLDSEAALRARVIELEADCAIYRELALAALDAVRTLTQQNDALRARCEEQADRLRAQYEEALLADGVDERKNE